MVVAVTSWPAGALCPVAADGAPLRPPRHVDDLTVAMADHERHEAPRWVWATAHRVHPRLLAAGLRVARCHDLELVGALLAGHAGRRAPARSVPGGRTDGTRQPTLFETEPGDDIEALIATHTAQLRALGEAGPGLSLLAAAESAGALVAAEMRHDGLPWRADVHDALLTGLLGPRPAPGMRPRRLQELADRIDAALGGTGDGRTVNPDSPGRLVRAFSAAGHPIRSTRSHVLRQVDHPAVPLVLEYKELARLHTAHGWSWLDTWVRDGRFRPEYVVGGVVSGRWATRGGGALQIPRVLRKAVVADPGWSLVVADAAQLEPRVLAALAGDRAFAAAAAQGDLYAALAGAFGGNTDPGARDKAKIALLSAMYGGGTGEALRLLVVLRNRFPRAFDYVEAAARAGETGRVVRSRLGRTCPPAGAGNEPAGSRASTDLLDPEPAEPAGTAGPGAAEDGDEDGPGRPDAAARSRGRFTRNFVVQASAADWALVLMATLRRRLADLPDGGTGRARLVFFQHDEVIVHAPREQAERVAELVRDSAAEAGRLVFGPTSVIFPLQVAITECYADAK